MLLRDHKSKSEYTEFRAYTRFRLLLLARIDTDILYARAPRPDPTPLPRRKSTRKLVSEGGRLDHTTLQVLHRRAEPGDRVVGVTTVRIDDSTSTLRHTVSSTSLTPSFECFRRSHPPREPPDCDTVVSRRSWADHDRPNGFRGTYPSEKGTEATDATGPITRRPRTAIGPRRGCARAGRSRSRDRSSSSRWRRPRPSATASDSPSI